MRAVSYVIAYNILRRGRQSRKHGINYKFNTNINFVFLFNHCNVLLFRIRQKYCNIIWSLFTRSGANEHTQKGYLLEWLGPAGWFKMPTLTRFFGRLASLIYLWRGALLFSKSKIFQWFHGSWSLYNPLHFHLLKITFFLLFDLTTWNQWSFISILNLYCTFNLCVFSFRSSIT